MVGLENRRNFFLRVREASAHDSFDFTSQEKLHLQLKLCRPRLAPQLRRGLTLPTRMWRSQTGMAHETLTGAPSSARILLSPLKGMRTWAVKMLSATSMSPFSQGNITACCQWTART